MHRPDIEQTLLIMFFAFLGGLTRELDDLISSKINMKNFTIGMVTAVTTGLIFGKILVGLNVAEDLVFGLSGIGGFIGPHLLFVLAKNLERKLEAWVPNSNKKEK